MGDFGGKVVLVTGGAAGIGAAAARGFARRGAHVVVADRDEEAARDVAGAIVADGGEATSHAVDVADEASVAALHAVVVARYGRLDCAFDNAGVSGAPAAFADVTTDDWQRVIGVDLTGVFLCMRAQIRQFLAQGTGGAIVVTSSGAGVVAAPFQTPYTAAKHGVVGLVKVAAQEYARRGIRVNAVLPGPTDTPMLRASMSLDPSLEPMIRKTMPAGRLGTAEEVAAAAVWLCSEEASFVNGVSLLVDGGQVAR